MAEDSKKVECIDGIERLKEAVDEIKKAILGPATTQSFEQMEKNRILEEFHASSRVFGKVEDIQMNPDGINFKCRCASPLDAPFTPRHSGRYPWVDIRNGKSREEIYDNIMIRKVLNMDSTRFNRFVSLLDAAGGHFQIDTKVGTESMATIQIPTRMLDHLHIDGDGSIKESSRRIPGIASIQVFNDRAVQITFIDGSQTKCVCGKDETFDLYEGIAFCLFKRFLGKEKGHKHFNDLMRYAFKKLDAQEESKKREAEIKAENKRHEEKKKLQAQRRKEKKREEKIGIFVEALKRNRKALINEMPVYSVPEPAFKPDENPYIAPGEPEPPAKPDEKAIDDGSTLFFDPLSGKTFISSREKVLLAVIALNRRILDSFWVSVNEWYEELGLDSSGNLGESMGWNIDNMVDIDLATDVTSDGRECLTIIYLKNPVRFEEGKA